MKRLVGIITGFVVTLGLTSSAFALTINDPGVVGAYGIDSGFNSSVANEILVGQHLLDMAAGTTDPNGCSLSGPCYQTSNTEYSGTLTGGIQSPDLGLGDHAYQVPAGYNYVLAKYDGPNAGYVLFYTGGAATTLSQYSYSIWSNGVDQNDYLISHFTAFNAVPDGGSTATLLGGALMAFGVVARRFRRN